METWRLIISGPGNGAGNMALDEALFLSSVEDSSPAPTLRLYSWRTPCITIGYFQKHADFAGKGVPVVRRLTGGLAVDHDTDISYAVVASEKYWPSIYDQEETYRLIHEGIREGLKSMGLSSEFSSGRMTTNPSQCVNTFFPHDLHVNGRKIAGSCQRRRGKHLLVQGSVHLERGREDFERCSSALARGWEEALGIRFTAPSAPDEGELKQQEILSAGKYGTREWNEQR